MDRNCWVNYSQIPLTQFCLSAPKTQALIFLNQQVSSHNYPRTFRRLFSVFLSFLLSLFSFCSPLFFSFHFIVILSFSFRFSFRCSFLCLFLFIKFLSSLTENNISPLNVSLLFSLFFSQLLSAFKSRKQTSFPKSSFNRVGWSFLLLHKIKLIILFYQRNILSEFDFHNTLISTHRFYLVNFRCPFSIFILHFDTPYFSTVVKLYLFLQISTSFIFSFFLFHFLSIHTFYLFIQF